MVHVFYSFEIWKIVKQVYPYENSQKEWKTYIFLGRVNVFYSFEIWKIVKKSVPLREKQSKGVKNIHFPRKGTLFLLFWNLNKRNRQKEWKTYIFLGRVHFFYSFEIWKIVKQVYPYERNSQKEWKTYIFLGRVHVFYSFEIWKTEKKCTLTRETVKRSEKHTFSSEGYTFFLLFSSRYNSGHYFFHYFFPGTVLVTIFFHYFFPVTVLVTIFLTDFLLINYLMFSRGWLKFPFTNIYIYIHIHIMICISQHEYEWNQCVTDPLNWLSFCGVVFESGAEARSAQPWCLWCPWARKVGPGWNLETSSHVQQFSHQIPAVGIFFVFNDPQIKITFQVLSAKQLGMGTDPLFSIHNNVPNHQSFYSTIPPFPIVNRD